MKNRWSKVTDLITLRRTAIILLVIAIITAVLGYINQHSGIYINSPFIQDFYANFSMELASIALTVLVIDTLNERRTIKQEKEQLIVQMGSPVNTISREAIRILRSRGWLEDGSLRGRDFSWANWEDAFLSGADLRDANLNRVRLDGTLLHKANLQGVRRLKEAQLIQLYSLDRTIMPDGRQYDGRYHLYGDVRWTHHHMKIPKDDTKAIAERYGISHEEYLAGQEWAKENLERLRQELITNPREVYVRFHKPVKEAPTINEKGQNQHSLPLLVAIFTIINVLILLLFRKVSR